MVLEKLNQSLNSKACPSLVINQGYDKIPISKILIALGYTLGINDISK